MAESTASSSTSNETTSPSVSKPQPTRSVHPQLKSQGGLHQASFISLSKEYQSFRRNIALQKKIIDHDNEQLWRFYDYGPKKIKTPLIFLPSAGGTAESFFKQLIGLGSLGFRLITVDYPPYWSHEDFVDNFTKFLDQINVEKVHLFGTALGGFLAQVFAALRPKRVESLILCNTFSDAKPFNDNAPFMGMFNWVPEFVLKRSILANFPSGQLEPAIADSVDFMVEQLESHTQTSLASRLTLNSIPFNLKPDFFTKPVTIIDTLDEVAISNDLRNSVREVHPHAKIALLKTGGNFPYLSRSDEVNMHIRIHCRQFDNTRSSPLIPPPEAGPQLPSGGLPTGFERL